MKPKLFLILICAIVLIAAVPRDVDEVARPDVSFTLTPVSYAYPAPYYPAQISTAYPVEATATQAWYPPPVKAKPTKTWAVPTEPPER